MHMVIDIGGWECAVERCHVLDGPPWLGHTRIQIWNAAQPFWERRPPWASLEFEVRPPKSATETLRWAVRTLDASLRSPARTLFDDDDWTTAGPVYEHPF